MTSFKTKQRTTSITSLVLLLTFQITLYGQDQQTREQYTDYKGMTMHLLVQPAWHNRSTFDTYTQNLGFPTNNLFAFNLGLGAAYLFKSGTSVGLEFATTSKSKEFNGNFTKIQPFYYTLTVKQYLLDSRKARFFAGAALTAVEQQYTFSEESTPTTITQAITIRNTSKLQRNIGTLGFNLGLTFKGEDPTTKKITDFAEIETGYRFTVDKPYYSVQNTDIEGLPGDKFNQFVFSIRAGLFVRSRQK